MAQPLVLLGTELGKGLELQEQLRELGKGLNLKERRLRRDLLTVHNSLTGEVFPLKDMYHPKGTCSYYKNVMLYNLY